MRLLKLNGRGANKGGFMIEVVAKPQQAIAHFGLMLSWLLLLSSQAWPQSKPPSSTVMEISRTNTVEIQSGDARGTGFVVRGEYVATAFHVAAMIEESPDTIRWSFRPNLKVRMPDGELIDATCITTPTEVDRSPLDQDFAVLKLGKKPKLERTGLRFSGNSDVFSVGDEVTFTGYPLESTFMLTHKGMISGFDPAKTVIGLQAAINKGNSGRAVLTPTGRVIGIITLRLGGLSKDLEQLAKRIQDRKTRVAIDGIDPLVASLEITKTLDRNISTGIGFARSIKFLSDYIVKHPELKIN